MLKFLGVVTTPIFFTKKENYLMAAKTRKNLTYAFDRAKKIGANYVGLMIQLPHAKEPEFIINPRVNFDEKLKYYLKNYDEELRHIHDKEVKIIGITYGDNFDEIEYDFFYDENYDIE